MLKKIVIIVYMLSVYSGTKAHAQQTPKQRETPNERFERKGGKSIKTEIIHRQDEELTSVIITKGRDLRLYDQGGHFNCRRWSPTALKKGRENTQRIESDLEIVRMFIWEHWQNKKRGYIRLTFDSVDAISTSHIFIEPDANGIWQISWRIARWHAMMSSGITDLPIIRQVERKGINQGEKILVFSDSAGEVWQSL
jgi:hypothetical protein